MPDMMLVVPVAGLPAGPATAASVKNVLHIDADDTLDNAALEQIINAANLVAVSFPYVARFIRSIDAEALDNKWPADIVQGTTMLAARLFGRKDSPQGVVGFGDDGATYVQHNDPDIAILLRIGKQAEPGVG